MGENNIAYGRQLRRPSRRDNTGAHEVSLGDRGGYHTAVVENTRKIEVDGYPVQNTAARHLRSLRPQERSDVPVDAQSGCHTMAILSR